MTIELWFVEHSKHMYGNARDIIEPLFEVLLFPAV